MTLMLVLEGHQNDRMRAKLDKAHTEVSRVSLELAMRPAWVSDFPEDYAKELAVKIVQNFGESFPADPAANDTYCISSSDLLNGITAALSWIDMDRLKATITDNQEVSS